MRSIILSVVSGAAALLFTMNSTTQAGPADAPALKGNVALQLYSLRNQFPKDVPGTMSLIESWGVKYVETAGTYGLTPEHFRSELDKHHLKAMGGHFGFDDYDKNIDKVIQEAKALGMDSVGCAWVPHDDNAPFSEARMREAIAVFNKAGETLAQHGIKFYYHVHGYEFQPTKNGTLFDLMMAETKPKFVSYEMDVFWVVHAGQDPVALLNRYGGRWFALHVKGMRDSTPTGLLTGHSDVSNDVALGVGKIDYGPILRDAEKVGVKWYVIEDESPSSEEQIPQSLKYLHDFSL